MSAEVKVRDVIENSLAKVFTGAQVGDYVAKAFGKQLLDIMEAYVPELKVRGSYRHPVIEEFVQHTMLAVNAVRRIEQERAVIAPTPLVLTQDERDVEATKMASDPEAWIDEQCRAMGVDPETLTAEDRKVIGATIAEATKDLSERH